MLTFSQAHSLQSKALDIATKRGVELAVAIVDSHGELLSFGKMDGASFHAAKLAQNKAYTAARDRQPTKNLAAWAQATGKDLAYWSDSRFTGIAGGVPIEQQGMVIGAIGISGMAEDDDEALAFELLSDFK